jgi:aminoglycoside phosphotransferase
MDLSDGTWTRISGGASGAAVFRRADQFAKRGDVAAEAERLAWLQGRLHVPPIVSARSDLLVTSALAGVPGDQVAPSRLPAVMLRALAALRALQVSDCPFRAPVASLVDEAAARVAAGLVDEEDFDDVRRGRTAAALLDELHRTRPAVEELTVCHGDLCPDNLIIDGDEIGFVDVGRLAAADRHRDLALVARALPSLTMPDADPARIAWFQLLDELY